MSDAGITIGTAVVDKYLETQVSMQKDALDFLRESVATAVGLAAPLVEAFVAEKQAEFANAQARLLEAQNEAQRLASESRDNGVNEEAAVGVDIPAA